MPELAAAYSVGLIVCLITCAIVLWRTSQKYQSPAYRQIDRNLARVGLYWNDQHSQFLPRDEAQVLNESAQARRALWPILILGCALSWLGVLLLGIFFLSLHVLARPRIEKKLFSSRLAEKDWTADEVRAVVQDINR